MVMGVPESGVPAAEGFARASGIPYGQGLVKNRYIGRSFIAPGQQERADAVRRKLNPLTDAIAGKRLVVVDDSIVRGTTQRSVIRMLREAGAAEVHLRISSPPWRWPCFYGIDTPSYEELLATDHTVEEMAEILGADSLAFISIENLKEAIGADGGFCDACFTGDYPTPVALARAPVDLGRSEPRAARGPPGRAARGLTVVGRAAPPMPAPAWTSPPATPLALERLRSMVSAASAASAGIRLRPRPLRAPGAGGLHRRGGDQGGGGPGRRPLRDHRHRPGRHVRRRPRLRGGRAPVHPRLRRHRQARPRPDGDRGGRGGRGLPPGRLRPARRRDGRAPRRHGAPTSSTWPASRSASSSARPCSGPDRVRAGDALVGLASPGLRSNGYTLARHVLLERAGLDLGGPAWPGADHSLADELLRPSVDLHPGRPGRHAAAGGGVHAARPHHRRGHRRQPARVLPADLEPGSTASAWEGRGSSPRSSAWARSTRRDGPGLQPRRRLGPGGRGRRGGGALAALAARPAARRRGRDDRRRSRRRRCRGR